MFGPLNDLDGGTGGGGAAAAPPAAAPPAAAPPAAAPPVAAPPAAAPGVMDSYTGIPESYSKDSDFANFKSVDEVFNDYKQLKGLEKNRTENGLIPFISEKSTPEQINQFYEKLGKPKAPAEYDLKRPESLPQGLDYSDEQAAKFAEFAHQNNLTKAQTQNLYGFYHDYITNEYNTHQGSVEAKLAGNLGELEKAWGGDHESDKFKQNHKNAMRAFNAVADKDLAAEFKADPMLASNPAVLKVLARLGAKMMPDSVPTVNDSLSTGQFQTGITGVEQSIKKFHEDGKFKRMLNPGDAQHKSLKEEWKSLNAQRVNLAGQE